MEKALLYIDNSELPVQWKKEELIGSEDEDDNGEETSEDEEQSEEKDRFVAQLYKFSDDRGTPINKGPCIGSKDLDLFKLFKVVQNLGGYNRVTNQMKWRLVYSKMLLPPSNTASTQIKNAYKKYLHAFEDFYRKLGSSMGTINRPSRSRHGSGRSIMNYRDKEKNADKTDSDRERTGDDTKSEFDSDAESISKQSSGGGTPKRTKSARVKLDLKDSKEEKKEEKKDEKKEEKKEEKVEIKKEEKEGKKSEDTGRKGKKVVEEKKDKKAEIKEETEKKGNKKKEDGTSPVTPRKKDTEEELKDLQKKISRRRSARVDEKNEEEEEQKKEEIKKEEVKESKRERREVKKEVEEKKEEKEEKKKETDEKTDKKPRRREIKKKSPQDDSDESDSETPATPSSSAHHSDLQVGTKMKVKYGRGRNAREYEAKVIEVGTDPGPKQYLVHYQGWNNRHDEWIKLDRIVKVLERPDTSTKKVPPKNSPKPGPKGPKKKALSEKQPASPSSVKSDSSTNQSIGRPSKSTKQQTPAQVASNGTTTPVPKGRPTRSNSIESKISEGLPVKRRTPKAPSITESANASDAESSDKSDNESDTDKTDKKPNREDKEDTPNLSSSMPSIISKKSEEEEDMDEDKNLDRSPPKLSKVTDLSKDKTDLEEKVEEVPEKVVKEEPVAPVLKVESEKNSEPILQKIEAQLNASSVVKVTSVKPPVVGESEEVEKDVKKKETDRKIKKTLKDKDIESSPKKAEKKMEEKTSVTELENTDTKTKIVVQEEQNEKELVKIADKKKPLVVLPQVKNSATTEDAETAKDDSSVDNQNAAEDASKSSKHNLTVEDKDTAKSDSEVERRGRKKKIVNKDDTPKDVKKPRIFNVEKKILDAPNLIEKKISNVQSERKPFVTLAEKKQGFSPIVRKVQVVASERSVDTSIVKDIVSVDEGQKDKTEEKEETRKPSEMVVVHKESPLKSDIVLGRKTEVDTPENGEFVKNEEDEEDKDGDISDSQIIKKKVRKKIKKKLDNEDSISVVRKTVKTRALSARGKESVRKLRDSDKLSDDESAIKESAIDIDLRCEESIRSRSASPEPVRNNPTFSHPDSQGFEFFVETVTSHLQHTQQGTSGLSLREDKSKPIKSNVYENTPPTTPEHDSDEASQPHSQSDQIKVTHKSHKQDTSQPEGHESPRGNASPSSNGSGGSSGIIGGSESSVDVPVHNNKRRRESEEGTPSKRRKRASRGKAAANRARQIAESDTDEASNLSSKCRSPHYTSDSYPSKTSQNASRSPRPLKYNFNLEEGKYLEGNARISFLIDKIQEIRKIYMNLKSEVASIDRRRKKLRRREKESASSSAVEVECS